MVSYLCHPSYGCECEGPVSKRTADRHRQASIRRHLAHYSTNKEIPIIPFPTIFQPARNIQNKEIGSNQNIINQDAEIISESSEQTPSLPAHNKVIERQDDLITNEVQPTESERSLSDSCSREESIDLYVHDDNSSSESECSKL